MGRGDHRSAKGKRFIKSFGNSRPTEENKNKKAAKIKKAKGGKS